MILKRFYEDGLAQASYMVGAESSGEALVIDPVRDVEPYVAAAAADGLRITHVTETHIHADFLSGARELVRCTGARLLLSAEGDGDWQYRFGPTESAELLRDGDCFAIGEARVEARHMPGHTPEHLVFFLTDGVVADKPVGVFTGDFIFAGDVGRPDLLERIANVSDTMEQSARVLFQSLRRMREFPDYLQLWPGHGAGSACGKSLGAMPSTTLGYERLFNWAFQAGGEDEFVRTVLAGQPEPPRYFGRMKLLNRDGPPPPQPVMLRQFDAQAVATLLAQRDGTAVIDTRPSATFATGFIPGTINIPGSRSFTTWVGSLISPDRDVILITDSEDQARTLCRKLSLIGVDRVIGWAGTEVIGRWRGAGERLETVRTVDAHALSALAGAEVIDVRANSEWNEGHIPGARHIFLGSLPEAMYDLPRDRPLVITCQGGSRSSIGISLLRASGFTNIINFKGGFAEWRSAGLPVEASDPSTAPG